METLSDPMPQWGRVEAVFLLAARWNRYHLQMHASPVSEVLPGVFRIADTCNVYVVRAPGERTAFTVDFGSGRVLDHLGEMGIDRITDVLMPHPHPDQGQ